MNWGRWHWTALLNLEMNPPTLTLARSHELLMGDEQLKLFLGKPGAGLDLREIRARR